MGLDVRLPIGIMFAILGALLILYGVVTRADARLYERSLSININLWWGLAMLLFGGAMLLLARRGVASRGAHPAEQSIEGRATEERERSAGLES